MGNKVSSVVNKSSEITEIKSIAINHIFLIGLPNSNIYKVVERYCENTDSHKEFHKGKMKLFNTYIWFYAPTHIRSTANTYNDELDQWRQLIETIEGTKLVMLCACIDDRFISHEMQQYTNQMNTLFAKHNILFKDIIIVDTFRGKEDIDNAIGQVISIGRILNQWYPNRLFNGCVVNLLATNTNDNFIQYVKNYVQQ